jgi:TatA/E family protein of Tat protein translocase
MGPLGVPEMIIIFVVALIVFGPRKLPELGRSLGKGLSEFKRASNDLRATLDDEIRLEDHRAANTQTAPAPAAVAAPVVEDVVDEAVTDTASTGEEAQRAPELFDSVPRTHPPA